MDTNLETLRSRANVEGQLQGIKDEVRDLKHITIGVDGNNGLRSRVKQNEEEIKDMKAEIKDITLKQTKFLGGLTVLGFVVEGVITHFWK